VLGVFGGFVQKQQGWIGSCCATTHMDRFKLLPYMYFKIIVEKQFFMNKSKRYSYNISMMKMHLT
jgi:hypothetical protein